MGCGRVLTALAPTPIVLSMAKAMDGRSVEEKLAAALAGLRERATEKTLAGLSRYAIDAPSAIGVSMTDMKAIAKELGRSHELAAALWAEGWYEARMLATLVDDPAMVSADRMESWARDFDNWAICDTACFCLFDRTADRWRMVELWAGREEEFVKRAAFALLASLTTHDKKAPDAFFLHGLELIEREAGDERNFVMKGISWALRGIGKRNPALREPALLVAGKLASSPAKAPRWIGKDTLSDLRARPAKGASLRRCEVFVPLEEDWYRAEERRLSYDD